MPEVESVCFMECFPCQFPLGDILIWAAANTEDALLIKNRVTRRFTDFLIYRFVCIPNLSCCQLLDVHLKLRRLKCADILKGISHFFSEYPVNDYLCRSIYCKIGCQKGLCQMSNIFRSAVVKSLNASIFVRLRPERFQLRRAFMCIVIWRVLHPPLFCWTG